jgi:hypothetical protein
MAVITITFSPAWTVALASEHATARLASAELTSFLQRLTGLPFPSADDDVLSGPTLYLTHDADGDDGFGWRITADGVAIHGHSPRGLLYGVYDFLEALGCRWLGPGEADQVLPSGQTFTLAAERVEETPALAGRCLILGHYAFVAEAAAWVIWAARNRYNTIFIHTIPNEFGGGAAPAWQWRALAPQVLPLLQERSMTIELGGHGLPALLPRHLFKTMPDAFRMENGRRTPQYNLCPSSPAARREVQRNARRYFLDHPGYDVYHVWADDIPGGGWCSCPSCQGLSPSDQLLRATNWVAEALAQVAPAAQLSFIAYMDTETPPKQTQPLPNVCLLWAPRTRCYAHATDDPACPVNTPAYPDNLRAQIAYFAQAEAAPPRVFEYYTDAILFKFLLPPFSRVMQRDLAFYARAGVHTVQTLMTGATPWLALELNPWLFARLAWRPDRAVDALVHDFCAAAYPGAAQEMTLYYQALEKAFAVVLDITPDQSRLDGISLSPLQMVKEPMADREDPVHAPLETLQTKARRLPEMWAALALAEQYLAAAQVRAAGPYLEQQAALFPFISAWLQFAARRIELYAALKTGSTSQAELRAKWRRTWNAYLDARRIAVPLLPAAPYRANFRVFHLTMWGLRLRRIQADFLTPPPLAWLVDLESLAQLVWTMAEFVGRMKWERHRFSRFE